MKTPFWKYLALLFAAAAGAAPRVEYRSLTLEQAVDLALRQNPDYLLARLDEQKARQAVNEARSPYVPRVAVGSGLAFSNGFPLSIEGSAPSIFQAYGTQYIYNRPQSFRVKEASEMAKAAAHSTDAKAEEIAYRVAAAYLDFERATRALDALTRQLESLTRVEHLVEDLVQAGREIPLEASKARVQTAKARSRLQDLQAHVDLLEESLRGDLGLGEGLRVIPVESELPSKTKLPDDEDAAVAAALANSKEIKRLQTILQSKRYQVQAEKATHYPRIDLVAQFALFGRFNNYEDFFKTFQRQNGQLGMSFQLPLFARAQISARVGQAETEIAQTNLRIAATRAGISLETRRLFREVRQTETSREVGRLELDLARETLTVMLAQYDEGRIALRKVEEARIAESQSWEAFYDAQTAADKARLNLLRETGGLLAALR